MNRDISHFATTKLQGDWSAPDFGKHLSRERLQALLAKFDRLDPLVRVRLLLAAMTLEDSAKQALQPELQGLVAAAREDKEEWVGIIGKAVGNFDAPLDLEAVCNGSSIVRDTLADLERRTDAGDDSGFRPLEETYLSKTLVEASRGGPEPPIQHSHFKLREEGSGDIPTLQSRASASAAAAVASVGHGSHPAADTLHPQAAFRAPGSQYEPAASQDSLAPTGRTIAAGGGGSVPAKSSAVDDMFRSSRPAQLGSRTVAPSVSAHTGAQERRGVARTVRAKLLDVDEVKQLNRPKKVERSDRLEGAASPESNTRSPRAHSRPQQRSPSAHRLSHRSPYRSPYESPQRSTGLSPHHGDVSRNDRLPAQHRSYTNGGHDRGHPAADEDDEAEEGELEAGELPDDSAFEPERKRYRSWD